MNYIKLISEKLSLEDITNLVASEKCGAISTFIGTTRDNFDGKNVVNLEYEAYESMAIKSLEIICKEIRTQWVDVENIAIYHRLGTVAVKEASIIIAISSPHRADAIKAVEWCIDNVKKSVPIWKKEVYDESSPVWKENKELEHPLKKFKLIAKQEVEAPRIAPHFIQIKAPCEEIEQRIVSFMERKREELNAANVRDFCRKTVGEEDEYSCARIDSVLIKRKDSKGHLQVNRIYNNYQRDQNCQGYLSKLIPRNGVEERIVCLESQLSLTKPTPGDVYKRLQRLENRLLHLESISPEYIQLWDRVSFNIKKGNKKKIYSLEEIDQVLKELEMRK